MERTKINQLIDKYAHDFEVSVVAENGVFVGVIIDKFNASEEGLNAYSVRHADDDWCLPLTIERRVVVNRYGTFLTDKEYDLKGDNYMELEEWHTAYDHEGNLYSVYELSDVKED